MIVTVAVIYFVAARLSLLMAFGSSNATPVWPPSGIALAALLIWGYRAGPAIFFGAFFANLIALYGVSGSSDYYILAAFTTAMGNMLEGVVGVYCIRRLSGTLNSFENIRDLIVFIIFGCLFSAIVGATAGVLSFCSLTGEWPLFNSLWITWWLGDAAGIIIVAPLIVMIKYKLQVKLGRDALIEAVFLLVILIVTTAFIFRTSYHLEYLIIPILLMIALRFGRLEAGLAVFLAACIAIAGTINGSGPVGDHVLNKSLLYLQSYLAVIAIITLCVSVLTYERAKAEEFRSEVRRKTYDISEGRFSVILNNVSDVIFAISVEPGGEFRFTSVNRRFLEVTGLSENQIVGVLARDVIPAPAQAMVFGKYHEAIRSGQPARWEEVSDYPAGRKVGHVTVVPVFDERGACTQLVGMVHDITERKESERALYESERKYRELVEHANSIILRWTRDGRITFLNEFGQRFFGYSAEEIIGRHVMGTIVPAADSAGHDLGSLMDRICADPVAFEQNVNENMRRDGERVWIAWTNKIVRDERDRVSEILSVGTDITELKRAEEAIRELNTTLERRVAERTAELAIAKEQAEAADRIKSAFLATMSHELRTPLNSIIGFTGIIIQKLAGPLNEEQERQLGMVRNSANHLLSLINDVLDISKIEAGQLEVYAEPFDALSVIDTAVSAMKPMADKKGLSLSVVTGPDIGEAIGDRRRVEQILLNLISNAIKFTERGAITLTVSLVRQNNPPGADSHALPRRPAISYRVTDTGIGIRTEDLKDLFQPFRQIDTGLTRKNEGTGLGLAICRRLAALMGGEIFAESEWGTGSSFTFILPLIGADTK